MKIVYIILSTCFLFVGYMVYHRSHTITQWATGHAEMSINKDKEDTLHKIRVLILFAIYFLCIM